MNRIIDMHCDTMMQIWERDETEETTGTLYDGEYSINIKKLEEGKSLAQCFALYLPWKNSEKTAYQILNEMHDDFVREMELSSEYIRQAKTVDEILKNDEDGFLSAILTTEDGAFIEDKIERIDEVYDWGVRMIGIIWNYENTLAYPNSKDSEIHNKGLKDFGFDCIEKMKEKGIIVDVSHLNEGGFYDVAKTLKGPFAASHSCSRDLCNHQRNLDDDQLRTLADCGGIVGINFCGPFLFQDGGYATFDRIIDHIRHIKNVAGIDTIGWGSDFDGIENNGELVDYRGFNPLVDAMTKHFTDDEIDKINYKNFLRVMREVQG